MYNILQLIGGLIAAFGCGIGIEIVLESLKITGHGKTPPIQAAVLPLLIGVLGVMVFVKSKNRMGESVVGDRKYWSDFFSPWKLLALAVLLIVYYVK